MKKLFKFATKSALILVLSLQGNQVRAENPSTNVSVTTK